MPPGNIRGPRTKDRCSTTTRGCRPREDASGPGIQSIPTTGRSTRDAGSNPSRAPKTHRGLISGTDAIHGDTDPTDARTGSTRSSRGSGNPSIPNNRGPTQDARSPSHTSSRYPRPMPRGRTDTRSNAVPRGNAHRRARRRPGQPRLPPRRGTTVRTRSRDPSARRPSPCPRRRRDRNGGRRTPHSVPGSRTVPWSWPGSEPLRE
jgi:hypothetical protein